MCSIHFLSLHDLFTYTIRTEPPWVSELPPCTKCKISALERKNPKLRDLGGRGDFSPYLMGKVGKCCVYGVTGLMIKGYHPKGTTIFPMNSPGLEEVWRNPRINEHLTQQGRYDGCRTHPIPLRKTTGPKRITCWHQWYQWEDVYMFPKLVMRNFLELVDVSLPSSS